MKKFLSIALAVVMMFAICIPAFATDITKNTDQTAQAEVVTVFDETKDWSYTVTIPAGVTVDWNNTTI